MEVKPRDDGLEKDYLWPEQPKVEVPDMIGQTKQELAEYLLDLTIETNGEGDYIADQSPKPGTKLEPGSTVRIYLSDEKHR